MRDFIRFLDSYKNLLIFLLLQLICFLLIFRSTVFQRSAMLSSINTVSGSIFSVRGDAEDYFMLRDENEDLVDENLQLIAKSRAAYEKVDKDYAIISDTLYQKRYTFQYANVIGSTKSLAKNYITLDKGHKHGVEVDMSVTNRLNLVGRVVKVTEHYSLVRPIINLDFVVAAKLKNSSYFGTVTWPGEDYRLALLKEIPKEAKINPGEQVLTRGGESLFPADIPIGFVEEVTLDEEGNFFDVTVKLHTDMSKLNKVMLIRDLHKGELDSLRLDIPQL